MFTVKERLTNGQQNRIEELVIDYATSRGDRDTDINAMMEEILDYIDGIALSNWMGGYEQAAEDYY